jgi:hypothetical protein
VFGVSRDGAGAAGLALLTSRAVIPTSLGFVDAAALPTECEALGLELLEVRSLEQHNDPHEATQSPQ